MGSRYGTVMRQSGQMQNIEKAMVLMVPGGTRKNLNMVNNPPDHLKSLDLFSNA